MDTLLSWIGAASLVLLIVASAVAWWEHRVRINQLRRDLALVENSRFMMEEQLRNVDARLQSMQVRMEAQKVQRSQPAGPAPAAPTAPTAPTAHAAPPADPPLPTLAPAQRPSMVAGSAGRAGSPGVEFAASTSASPSTRSRRPQVWADTLPMEALNRPPPARYEETRPMDLPER